MVHLLWAKFDPNRILLRAGPEIARYQPAIAAMTAPGNGTAVYVCEDFACQEPVTREEDLARLLI
jgi:uncharacterized protein YyaL (SSP411 family)